MARTFQITCNYVSGYTLSDRRGLSNSAVLTKTTARFPCSPHKLNGRLKCALNSRRPVVCRASSGGSESEALKERFNKWIQTHDIVYEGGEEEWKLRFEIYKSNLQLIEHTNSLNLSYKLTDNRFADMTNAEFKARYCGYKIPDPVTAVLEPESEPQLDSSSSYQEEEEDGERLEADGAEGNSKIKEPKRVFKDEESSTRGVA